MRVGIQLPDDYYNSIQSRWDNLESAQWEIGKELNAIIGELSAVMKRAGIEYPRKHILRLTAKNTTANYDSLDDYERVYRNWQGEERFDLNWSLMRACISKDIKDQRKWALKASKEGLSAKQIYRLKTGKTWIDDIDRIARRLRQVVNTNYIPKKEAQLLVNASELLEEVLVVAP